MISVDRLRTVLDYNAATGVFTWRESLSAGAPVGSPAGTVYKNGRRYITIDRKRHFSARLAWFYVHGEWPTFQVDHRNCNKLDDRIDNLRLATPFQNSGNKRVSKRNELGIKGVGISPRVRKTQRYRARIRVHDQLLHLGYFSTPEEASAAYEAAATKHFGEFARAV